MTNRLVRVLPFPPARGTSNTFPNVAAHIPDMTTSAATPQTPLDLCDLATAAEIAQLVRRASKTVERWSREGRIPSMKIGNEWRYARPAIVFWDAMNLLQTERDQAESRLISEVASMFSSCPARMSVAEAAAALCVTQRTFLDLCRNGHLPAVKAGRSWYLDREALRERIFESVARWDMSA